MRDDNNQKGYDQMFCYYFPMFFLLLVCQVIAKDRQKRQSPDDAHHNSGGEFKDKYWNNKSHGEEEFSHGNLRRLYTEGR